eukprot:14915848-Alexandrium_andersonii.AAC.1
MAEAVRAVVRLLNCWLHPSGSFSPGSQPRAAVLAVSICEEPPALHRSQRLKTGSGASSSANAKWVSGNGWQLFLQFSAPAHGAAAPGSLAASPG